MRGKATGRIALLMGLLSWIIFPADSGAAPETEALVNSICTGGDIIPFPRRVTYFDQYWDLPSKKILIRLESKATGPRRVTAEELRDRLSALLGPSGTVLIAASSDPRDSFDLQILIGTPEKDPGLRKLIPSSVRFGNAPMPVRDEEYAIRFIADRELHLVLCVGAGPRGCYFATQSLLQLFVKDEETGVRLRVAEVDDWPSFELRSTSVFQQPSEGEEETLNEALGATRWLGFSKFNTINVHYLHNQPGSWRAPPAEYREYAREATLWARRRDLNVMDFVNPFFGEPTAYSTSSKIVISRPEELDALVNSFRCTFDYGANMAMLCMDDFVPNPFPPYHLTNDEDREHFEDLAEATIYLIHELQRRLRELNPEARLIWCPPWFSTWMLDEMKQKQGIEMVRRVTEAIPQDVAVVWTGPGVRSKAVAVEDIEKWQRYTGREKPFLWDNTFYERRKDGKHIGVNILCDLFETRYPEKMWQRVDEGIHYNNASSDAVARIGLLDLANYLWNPEAYDPELSREACIRKVAGVQAVKPVLRFRGTYYALFELLVPPKWYRTGEKPETLSVEGLSSADVEHMASLSAQLKEDLKRVEASTPNGQLVEALSKQAEFYTRVIDYQALAERVKAAEDQREKAPRSLLAADSILGEIRQKDWEHENDPTLLWRLCRRMESAIYRALSAQPDIEGYDQWLERVRREVGKAATESLPGQMKRSPHSPAQELWFLHLDRYRNCPLAHRLDLEIFAQEPVLVAKYPTEFYENGWRENLPAPVAIDMASAFHGREWSSGDCRASVGVFWTDERLYVAVQVADPTPEASSSGESLWRQDSVQVGIDPRFNPYESRRGYAHDDVEVGVSLVGDTVAAWAWKTPQMPASDFMDGIAVAARRDTDRIHYQFAFPWTTVLPGESSPPRILGLAVLINDWDQGERAFAEWGGGISGDKDPRRFKTLLLVE